MTSKRVYLLSLGAILLASVYPIYMGAVMIAAYIRDGGIDAADYPSYVIPYTPVCIALLLCAALLPLIYRLCKRFALLALSAFGAAAFLAAETGFERIAVFTDVSAKMNIETWQLLSCVVTPLVRESVWDSLNMRYHPSFKLHFYAIALLIVLAVTGIVYGFYRMAKTRDYARKKPLAAQLIAVTVFVGLCVLACFTAFFRTGDIQVSAISAVLMTAFFLAFGVTAGIYAGTWLYGKKRRCSVVVPSAAAVLVTLIMYIGEMVMMGWSLFRLGSGPLFDPIGILPLSAFDVMTVLLSGAATWLILTAIKPREPRCPR